MSAPMFDPAPERDLEAMRETAQGDFESREDIGLTAREAVERLTILATWNRTAHDNEVAHGNADDILLDAADPEVRDAYKRVMDTCDWWASA